MMKNLRLRYELHIPNPSCSSPNPQLRVKPIKLGLSNGHPPSKFAMTLTRQTPIRSITLKKHTTSMEVEHSAKSLVEVVGEKGQSRMVITGAICVGIFVVVMSGMMDEQKAFALGPEGPLVEEFWDNVRRYALYALSVSTGAIYTILQPIFELLKNPISAILIVAIFGGSIYIVSQVLSAMVGVSDFSYDYGY